MAVDIKNARVGATRRIIGRAKSFRRDRRGAAAVEFAIIAAPFFGLLIAILQISATAFAQQTLETASDKAVRQLVTGQAQAANMTKDGFRALLCSKLPAFLKCANVLIDIRTVTTFSAADTSRMPITFDAGGNIEDKTRFEPGGGGALVVARVMYLWDVQPGPLGFDISTMSDNRRLLTAVSVFKTEPY